MARDTLGRPRDSLVQGGCSMRAQDLRRAGLEGGASLCPCASFLHRLLLFMTAECSRPEDLDSSQAQGEMCSSIKFHSNHVTQSHGTPGHTNTSVSVHAFPRGF